VCGVSGLGSDQGKFKLFQKLAEADRVIAAAADGDPRIQEIVGEGERLEEFLVQLFAGLPDPIALTEEEAGVVADAENAKLCRVRRRACLRIEGGACFFDLLGVLEYLRESRSAARAHSAFRVAQRPEVCRG
jgi:hypothetical protein